MAKESNSYVLKTILICIYIPLALISLFFVSWLVYYEINIKDNTLAIHTNFVDDATYAEDETFFMEIQIYENVVEWKWNYYVDTSLPDKNEDGSYDNKFIFSTGVQFYSQDINDNIVAKCDVKNTFSYIGAVEMTNATFYSNDGKDTAYISGGTKLANQDKWIFDVGGELCMIKAKGDIQYDAFLWTKVYQRFDPARLIAENWESALSCENGTSIRMFDFSRYFTLLYPDETGKFTKEVVDENILEEWTFMNVKVTKYTTDMISASQSLFGSYKGDSEWQADGSENSQTYWMDETVYHIDNSDLRYVAGENGYNLSLKPSCETYLSEFSDLYIVLDIDLDKFESILNIQGFTDNPFGEIEVDEINLTSDTQRDFIVYDRTLNINTENVRIVYGGAV